VEHDRQGRWRRLAIALLSTALIGAAIWWLEAGTALPLFRGSGKTASEAASFSSQAGGGLFGAGAGRLGAAAGPAPKIGEAAPDFTLLSLDGTAVRLGELRRKTGVINLWATWCIPCKSAFPELVELYKQQAERGLVVLGVNLHTWYKAQDGRPIELCPETPEAAPAEAVVPEPVAPPADFSTLR